MLYRMVIITVRNLDREDVVSYPHCGIHGDIIFIHDFEVRQERLGNYPIRETGRAQRRWAPYSPESVDGMTRMVDAGSFIVFGEGRPVPVLCLLT